LKEYRCPKCKKLLFKTAKELIENSKIVESKTSQHGKYIVGNIVKIEIKCHNCKKVSEIVL
jgi:phage FluMu protein Com